ncbi:MAG: hypothetical protein CMO55_17420 [Verrucomicrobiales bacterium]|nr:hypothetical protein [Verrucomicrobiales bacterium]
MELKPLPPDFKDFIEILNKVKVRYMVVGGWALGFHGWPRLTKDIDIWVAVDPENEKAVCEALVKFGAPGPTAADFFTETEKNVYFMGLPPNRIEVISSIDGVTFDDCYERSVIVEHGGVELRVIGLEDFKTNKRESGRYQDLADLDQLG